jgi:cobalt-zinc-cadmium efflux system outer membrane protein
MAPAGGLAQEVFSLLRRILTIGLLGTLLLNPLVGFAETPNPLTLDEAIRLAVENNAQLKAVQAKLGISEAEILIAGARLNPSLLSDNGIAEDTYRLGIEQTIELGGKRHKRVLVANAQRLVMNEEVNQALLDLKAQVRKAYTRLFYAQEQQHAYQEILTTTEKLVEITQKRQIVGDVAQLDVLQAKIAMVNARNELQTSANRVTEAFNHLNTVINKPLETRLQLAAPQKDPKASLSLNSLLTTALEQRPELKKRQEQLDVSEKQILLAKANRIPNLSLTVGPDLVTASEGNNQVNVFAIANIELPFWNRQQGAIELAKANRVQVEREIEATRNIINMEVTNAYNSFFTQQTRLMHYETEILPIAQEVLEKSKRSFEEGKSNILVPISAQQAYINSRLGYLQTLGELQNAISDLERATGAAL